MASLRQAWRDWRDRRTLERRPIPEPLWALTLARFPFLHLPQTGEAARLRELSTLFLARKEFHGAGGFHVTDAVAVAIAAQACLPVLHLGLDWYDAFIGIVVHEGEVLARRRIEDEDGVVHHYDETLTGEAMENGPVMLSWQDVAEAAATADWGYNVVIHEFAHVLDVADGHSDGMPPLASRAAHEDWERVFAAAYESFCIEVNAGRETLLDPYGAEAPAEFFAVACEAFFVAPLDLRHEQPAVYRLLSQFFRQDPAARVR